MQRREVQLICGSGIIYPIIFSCVISRYPGMITCFIIVDTNLRYCAICGKNGSVTVSHIHLANSNVTFLQTASNLIALCITRKHAISNFTLIHGIKSKPQGSLWLNNGRSICTQPLGELIYTGFFFFISIFHILSV